MKTGRGWGEVIRFMDYKSSKLETPEAIADDAVCRFFNVFVDVFNTQPIGTRLHYVGMLLYMVMSLGLAALIAQWKRIPYVHPTHLETSSGERVYRLGYSEKD